MKVFLKVIVIGDYFVGKTSIQERYVLNRVRYERRSPTPDILYKELIVDGKQLTMQIWDTYGQERFSSYLVDAFCRGTDCCVLTFDVTKEDSFVNLEYWKEKFRKITSYQNNTNSNLCTPLIVFANKIDLTTKRVITRERAESWCKENGNIPYFEVSAKDDININEAFAATAKLALDQYLITHTDSNSLTPLTIPPDEEPPKYTISC